MRALALAALVALAGCADAQMLGATAAEHRRVMNDIQARATLAAACDISVGAFYRLQLHEREAVQALCGDPLLRLEALP